MVRRFKPLNLASCFLGPLAGGAQFAEAGAVDVRGWSLAGGTRGADIMLGAACATTRGRYGCGMGDGV